MTVSLPTDYTLTGGDCDLHNEKLSPKCTCKLLPPQGFGPEAKTRGGIIMVPAYKYMYLQIEISTYSMVFSLCIWKKSRFAKSGRAV